MGEREKTIRFGLRLPASLYGKIQERAQENDRSVNAEIVATLNADLGAEFDRREVRALRLLTKAVRRMAAQSGDRTTDQVIDELTELFGGDVQE
jgi:hypothetical protein